MLGELLQASLSSLKQIPAHELGSYEMVVAYQAITGSMAKILGLVAEFNTRQAFVDVEAGYLFGELHTQCSLVAFRWEKFKNESGFSEPDES